MNPGTGAGQPKSGPPLRDKSRLREQLLTARAARPSVPAQDAARQQRILDACLGADVVALYLSRRDEPSTTGLLAALHQHGVSVLLPVLRREPDWAWYAGPGTLAPGPFGIPQPTGAPLGAAALAQAEWIWLPGLAGTPTGQRLGTGGGWYDRALHHAATTARRGLLLFDDEVLHDLPVDPWDQPVHLLVTESRWIDCLSE